MQVCTFLKSRYLSCSSYLKWLILGIARAFHQCYLDCPDSNSSASLISLEGSGSSKQDGLSSLWKLISRYHFSHSLLSSPWSCKGHKDRYMIRGLKDAPRKERGHEPDCLYLRFSFCPCQKSLWKTGQVESKLQELSC